VYFHKNCELHGKTDFCYNTQNVPEESTDLATSWSRARARTHARATHTHTHTHTQKRCKSDRATSMWYTLGNAVGGAITFILKVTPKYFFSEAFSEKMFQTKVVWVEEGHKRISLILDTIDFVKVKAESL